MRINAVAHRIEDNDESHICSGGEADEFHLWLDHERAKGVSSDSSTSVSRLFREEESQIIQGEALGEAFFSQDVIRQCAFLFLQLADFLLDGVAHEQSVSHHFPGLADAVSAVDGLVFNRGIPPRIEEDNVRSRGKIQSKPAGLE